MLCVWLLLFRQLLLLSSRVISLLFYLFASVSSLDFVTELWREDPYSSESYALVYKNIMKMLSDEVFMGKKNVLIFFLFYFSMLSQNCLKRDY